MSASPYVMDSSIWVSFFQGSNAIHKLVIKPLREGRIIVPSICLYEVALAIERRIGEDQVKIVIANMREQVIDELTATRALAAAYVRKERKMAMADAIVYATTVAHDATLITHDRDFEGLPNVMYLKAT